MPSPCSARLADRSRTPGDADQRRTLADQREADQQSAAVTYEELRDQLAAGDDTVTALDLATAHFQVERTTLLVPPAKAAIKRAEKAVEAHEAQTSPTLAQWLHKVIEKNPFAFGLQGMPITVVPTVPQDAEGPAVFLTQTKPTSTDLGTGMMSGTVWVHVVLPEHATWEYIAFSTGAKRLISDAGLARYAEVIARQQLTSPKLTIELVDVEPELPVLPIEAPEHAAQGFRRHGLPIGRRRWRPD
ncbi:hypothetical protein OWR29_39075 [Actinoplanes sp. Pm04-4]|uniref:Uncharacterized protein n=1 Tax=Paractinoplanes pyxinae TaxID=2997416 RepID=A0ABT4BBY4_9ACTN|nr:hypothetical protein [Actinoplanes pyxinae]MCY1144034.1 hypothetical protein [Actinoplanes pyxinae]